MVINIMFLTGIVVRTEAMFSINVDNDGAYQCVTLFRIQAISRGWRRLSGRIGGRHRGVTGVNAEE